MSLSTFIPNWFFGIDAIFYIVALIIGLATAFYAYKVYAITGKKQHFYLFMGFTVLSIAFLSLAMTSTYVSFRMADPGFMVQDQTFDIIDFGFFLYYAISLIAYGFLVSMYLPEKKQNKPMFAFLPWWFIFFPFFHLVSVLMLAFVVFRSFINWHETRTRSGFAVFVAFSGIGLFHLLSFFTFLYAMFYILASLCLIVGSLSLLVVLFKVSRR